MTPLEICHHEQLQHELLQRDRIIKALVERHGKLVTLTSEDLAAADALTLGRTENDGDLALWVN